jgi:hypothetical protein
MQQHGRVPTTGSFTRERRTTCCHTFRSSSTRTGLIRKSTAPWVTPRNTTLVSPFELITARTNFDEPPMNAEGNTPPPPTLLTECSHKLIETELAGFAIPRAQMNLHFCGTRVRGCGKKGGVQSGPDKVSDSGRCDCKITSSSAGQRKKK